MGSGVYVRTLQHKLNQSIAAFKRYENSHCYKWGGGRRKSSKGYILLWMPEYPNCMSDGYVFEHRYLMEQHMGRTLDKDELVHHINKITDDNRIENLQVIPRSEHIILHGVKKPKARSNYK
jgi:hypothetical protein